MATSTALLESVRPGMLADEEDPPTAKVIRFEKAAPKHRTVDTDITEAGDDFLLFLAGLKADVEQTLISSMVNDLRQLLSRLKPD